jgi:hypothetical protein
MERKNEVKRKMKKGEDRETAVVSGVFLALRSLPKKSESASSSGDCVRTVRIAEPASSSESLYRL